MKKRLGALSNTIANIQIPLSTPPPRRLEMSRRLPSSLRDLGGNGGTTQSFVIPVVQGQNGPEIGGNGLQQQIQSHIAGLINQEQELSIFRFLKNSAITSRILRIRME